MSPRSSAYSDGTKGFLFALSGAVLLSTNFITGKYALEGFHPETFALIWTAAASFYSLMIVLFTGGWEQLALPWSSLRSLIFIGIATGIGMLLGWTALDQLDPSFTAFLGRFRPVLIIVLSFIILGERLASRELLPIGMMIAGCIFSAVGRWEIVGTGIVLAMSAAFMAAIQQVIAKIAVARAHPNVMVFYRVVIAFVIIGTWNLLAGRADFDVELSYWLVLLLGALLGPTLSFHLMYRAYRYWELSRASTVIIAQPLIVLPLAYVFLGTLPAEREMIGGFIIMAGAAWLGLIHFSAGRKAETAVAVPKQNNKLVMARDHDVA
ncbi:MAG: DMT family transporter [Fidelibacterota bacterium]|nr:MAG: DMT family transporter [Candidatus Neomarinimicrobiota bacterium]